MRSITALLLDLRKAGLTQSEIARRTGIPQPRVSRWEAGQTPAGANDALKVQALHRECVKPEEQTAGAGDAP